jgi:hypothetical protein
VHHTPPDPTPASRSLSVINADIAALMRQRGGTPAIRAERAARYHELLQEYLDARESGGREGEDDEEWAAA